MELKRSKSITRPNYIGTNIAPKLTVEETKEFNDIEKVINIPYIKDWVDRRKSNFSLTAKEKKSLVFYMLKVNGKIAGFCVFSPIKQVGTSIGEIAVLKQFRGAMAKYLALEAIECYKKHYECFRIITRIEKENKPSLIFASWLDFKRIPINDRKYIYLILE